MAYWLLHHISCLGRATGHEQPPNSTVARLLCKDALVPCCFQLMPSADALLPK